MSQNNNTIGSIILFVHSEKMIQNHLCDCLSRFSRFLKKHFAYYEIILVVNPSCANDALHHIVFQFKKIHVIELSTGRNKNIAYYAAMHTTIGDAVFMIDDYTIQDDMILDAMHSVLSNHADIVIINTKKCAIYSQTACYSRKAIHFLLLQKKKYITLGIMRKKIGLKTLCLSTEKLPNIFTLFYSMISFLMHLLKRKQNHSTFVIQREWCSDNELRSVEKNITIHSTLN